MERIFPLHSPRYERIDVVTRGSVSRNRLFYLRNLKGKASRVDVQEEVVEEAAPAVAAATGDAPSESPETSATAASPKKAKGKKAKAEKTAG